MTSLLRQIFLFLVALAALAIVMMMVATADAAEPKSDGTRQIVVEESTQDKGAASTDLTAESGNAPAETLASEKPAPEASDEKGTDTAETELTERKALALAHLYALYLRAAQHGHSAYDYSYSHGYSYGGGYSYGYDHCDD
jgi:hypothetical protein